MTSRRIPKRVVVSATRKRRNNLEHQLQKAVADYLMLALRPPTIWTSIDAGAGKMSKATAGMRKARGVKAGWADILVFHPVEWPMATPQSAMCVIAIELKIGMGDQSEAQEQFQRDWEKAGGLYYLARSLNDVHNILEYVGVPVFAKPWGKGILSSIIPAFPLAGDTT